MTAQELIVFYNNDYTKRLFDRARKVPADKLEWKPDGEGRSVLDVCQECALSPTWPAALLAPEGFQMTPELMEAFAKAKAELKTVDECEAKARENLKALNDIIIKMSDEELTRMVKIPFAEEPWHVHQALQMHLWNAVYHTGQVCYIQTLYGDKSM